MSNYRKTQDFVRMKIQELNEGTPQSKAALAQLRRGIGKEPGATPEIWDITFNKVPEELTCQGKIAESEPTRAEWAIHTALTLYALHKQGKTATMDEETKETEGKKIYGSSLGRAARKLVKSDKENEETIKRRFDAVATAKDLTELAHHARGLVQLLKAEDIPLDYHRFAGDLYLYQDPDRQNAVKLRWGEDFWRYWGNEAGQKDQEQKEGAKE
jgi:CRISPR system Cascade subunit CasB